ncbi:transcription factor Pcc1-domain-containing protein [Talaromyces proteolyticus]|uniref:Transcription factor Pcc1-domain-containing protein n=1 Tax=Talaromyces proteolyticus TaxID=1131652 RepID=A0AAD4KTH5_9EURO|nr:transcription factor Pcc1-domain-containing protein [Talaromyces proteolyticus]KAH8695570.1 transcription factor Pcc1-domain-containing protein [Talaromyces proteolyticus]
MSSNIDSSTDFPYSLVISLPLPTHRLASAALQAIQVDQELSSFVRRSHALVTPSGSADDADEESRTVLETTYRATTNRMLRVSVNGFMETLGVVLEVMEELDTDVLDEEKSDKGRLGE